MTIRMTHLMAGMAFMAGLAGVVSSADAQTATQVCSTKYQAAKTAGTLNGQSWNQFRSACSKEAKAAPAAAEPAATPAAATTTAAAPAPANPLKPAAAPVAPAPTAVAPPAMAPAAIGNAVFPSAVSPKYSTEKAGVARRKTCDDQYNANKASGGNGGLKWIQKGGGYYSECNKHLKG
jgi:hypothetical protein